MNNLEKAVISKPNKRYKSNLHGFHETTTGFMLPNVPFFFMLEGKDTIEMHADDFNRLNPMPVPTMGECKIKLAWYFVPRRVIFSRVMEFMTNTMVEGLPDDNLFIDSAPYFEYHELLDYITEQMPLPSRSLLALRFKDANDDPIVVSTLLDAQTYFGDNATNPADFIDGNGYVYKFTSLGLQVKTILEQLGIAITAKLSKSEDYINAESILAFCKVMIDHYIPRYWEGYVNNFPNLIKIMDNIDNYADSNIGVAWIPEFVSLCSLICYNDDYFTETWASIGGPNGGAVNPEIINGVSGNIEGSISGEVLAVLKGTGGDITQQDLNTLKALDKYMKKNQIVGCKYWDRLLAHFGISTEKALLKVSEKITDMQYPIIFGEVMSSAETKSGSTGDNLGSYAGKGNAYLPDVMTFTYTANEPGFLICIKSIVPEVAYCNNFSALAFKRHRLDFYNEEFDAMGSEPINSKELYSGYDLPQNIGMTSVFGFLPRYASLKSFVNKVSGKYSTPSLRTEFDAWTFCRWFGADSFSLNANNDKVVQTTPDFNVGAHDGYRDNNISTQYDRIFYVPTEHNFNCYTSFNFNIKSLKKPLYSYEEIIEDDEKEYTVSVGNKND